MAETSFTRPRAVAVFGLILQTVAFGALLVLARATHSTALAGLGWYVLGGVPLWFTALLIFRQRELAALEKMDLEELRREKAAGGGGGEAIFDEAGGAGLSYMVAETRLTWMQRWLVPAFGLLNGLYLLGYGALMWRWLKPIGDDARPDLEHVSIALIVLSLAMLLLFLFARFAAGMGRVADWRLLRACGSFMLGNAVAALAVIVALGVSMYASIERWEHVLSFIVPGLMMLLGLETLVNFVLDIYRPRVPGVEGRAAFDSRILGLISEPGGIASTVAEMINYQFGFQVSQTWFYRLIQRTFIPLALFGIAALWVLTTVVIIQPYEQAIIERFGRQLDAHDPLGPGLHFKLPWPIDVARKYNTRELHQIVLGFKADRPGDEAGSLQASGVVQWTDPQHENHEEYNFLVAPPNRSGASTQPSADAAADQSARRVPMHILRMTVAVQYRILSDKLSYYSQRVARPEQALRDIAWQELIRFDASCDAAGLIGEHRDVAGERLRKRLSERVARLGLGLDIVYVGFQDVHPEKTVAEAYRNVIAAEHEKITEIRKALVRENQTLSRIAGDKMRALALATAIDSVQKAAQTVDQLMRAAPAGRTPASDLEQRMLALRPAFEARLEAEWALRRAEQQAARIRMEAELGLGTSILQTQRAEQALQNAQAQQKKADDALNAALAPIRAQAGQSSDVMLKRVDAKLAEEFWNRRIQEQLVGLEGQAAVLLAEAQARRWAVEMKAAAELIGVQKQRDAYRAAPEIYKARAYLQALTQGIAKSRKYFMVIEPGKRNIMTRIEAQEQARPDITDRPIRKEE